MNIVIYSNCQADAIITLLKKKIKGTYHHIENFKYLNNSKNLPFEKLKKADLFIFQFTKKEHGICSTDINSEENIFNYLKKECLKIGIPSMYQSAFWPILPSYDSPCGHEIIKEFKKKKYSFEKIYEFYDIKQINFKLKERFNKCEKHTKDIETYYLENTNLTIIPITPFIRNNYKKYKLFLTNNHPSIYIFFYIVNEIIKIINKKNNKNIKNFENIFNNKSNKYIEHLEGYYWVDSYYIIKELDVEYIKECKDEIIKQGILQKIYNNS